MKQYKHILVPVDFSEHSKTTLEQAIALQKKDNAKLTVVHYIEPLPAMAYAGSVMPELDEEIEKYALAQMISLCNKHDIDPSASQVIFGYAKHAIVDSIKELSIDLVVIGSHGHNTLMSKLLGSTSAYVANHATCDVLITRP